MSSLAKEINPSGLQVSTITKEEGGVLKQEITETQANIPIEAGDTYELLNESLSTSDGTLNGFRIVVNSSDVIMEVVTYGDDQTTPRILNNLTMKQCLAFGMGLTPGEVEPALENGRSQDKVGVVSDVYPYLMRYKDDDQEDILGYTDKVITLMFTPSIAVAYKRMVINIHNTGADGATVFNLSVLRTIIQQKESDNATAPRVANKGQYSNVSDVQITTEDVKRQRIEALRKNIDYGFVPPTPKPIITTQQYQEDDVGGVETG